MSIVISVIQIFSGVLLTILVLLQAKGTGLGRAFGGGQAYHSKRGVENLVFKSTIVLSIIFVITSIAGQLFFS